MEIKKFIRKQSYCLCKKFSESKSQMYEGYVKPCIRENNLEYVILHVGTNELNSELTPERIAKSYIDVRKNIQTNQVY